MASCFDLPPRFEKGYPMGSQKTGREHMHNRRFTRREHLRTALGASALAVSGRMIPAFALPAPQDGDEPIPFLDPQPIKPDRAMLHWAKLDQWVTPEDQFFSVQHYGVPEVPTDGWSLEIGGMVRKPVTLTLDQIRSRPKQSTVATLECAGNGVSPGFMGAIGNLRWGGTALTPLLEGLGLHEQATEVVFHGADEGTETIREKEYKQNFARSLSLRDVKRFGVMLLYEMAGKPLTKGHGGPLRVGVPGHFGIAWVKWVNRIEIIDQRYSGRFMARDYVTIRGERRGDQIVWGEKGVSRLNLKSIVARVSRKPNDDLRVMGAAWNDGESKLDRVELKIDDGPWRTAKLGEGQDNPRAWTFWSFDWKGAAAGEHRLTSRAIDAAGRIQPAADDDAIALKRTYWEANQQVPRRIEV